MNPRTKNEAKAAASGRAAYRALGLAFDLCSPSPEALRAAAFLYEEMQSGGPREACAEVPAVSRQLGVRIGEKADGAFEVFFDSEKAFEAGGLGDLLHSLDNELTVLVEKATPSLYFVHAAAVEVEGRATLLVGPSGSGKSTTAFALVAAGAGYLSDELAPLDPARGLVHPYPRALCLKGPPPPPLELPADSLETDWTIHVRPSSLPGGVRREPCPLGRIVFVEYRASTREPVLRPISRGEAALRLYQQALNQLAHPCMGLDSTLDLVRRAECCELLSAGIPQTLEALGT